MSGAAQKDEKPYQRPDLSGAPNIIEIKDLVTQYGKRKILHKVSLDVREGEILVIMGGSG